MPRGGAAHIGGAGGATGIAGASTAGDGGAAGGTAEAGSAGACSDRLFEPARNIPVGLRPIDIATADLNSDGKADLVTLNQIAEYPLVEGSVNVLLGHGDGTFDNSEQSGPRRNPTALALGDFDGDGHEDMVVTHSTVVDRTTLALGRGDGSFAAASELLVTGESQTDVAIGDVNNDGRPDIVVTNQYTHDLTLLLNEGWGGFRSIAIASTAQPQRVVIGDLDHDGAPDLVVGVWSLSGTRVIPMRGSGLGGFAAFPALDPDVFPAGLGVADFDRDGHPDLVIAGTNAVQLLRGRPQILEYDAGVSWAIDGGTTGLAIADFDLDGSLDVAVTCLNSAQIEVLFGAQDATFPRRMRFDVETHPIALVAADFNGDGWPDLAVSNRGSNSVSVLLGSARRACR